MKFNTVIHRVTLLVMIFFLVVQTFSYFLDFYDQINESNAVKRVIDFVYYARNGAFFLLFVLIALCNKYSWDCLIIVFCLIFSLFVTTAIRPENMIYFRNVSAEFFLGIGTLFAVRSEIIDFSLLRRVLRLFSWIVCIASLMIFYQYQDTMLFRDKYMDFSNGASIACGLLLLDGIIERRYLDLLLGVLMYFVLFIAGGRGAFLTLTLLILVLLIIRYNTKKNRIILTIIGIAIIPLSSVLPTLMIVVLNNLDFESRTIEKLLYNNLLYADDRNELYKYLISVVKENNFLGGGICADRYYLAIANLTNNGYYTHNIILELLVDFGVIGVLIFGYLLFLIYNFLSKKEIPAIAKGFVSVYVVIAIVQLFFSRSWLTEYNFFALVALLLIDSNYFKTNESLSKCNHSYIQK